MLSRILLALSLAAPTAVLAQYATIGPNGQVTTAGSVVVVGNGGGPALSTPNMTFGATQSTAGISLADHAGISNTAPVNPAIPSTSESYPLYSNTNAAGMGVQPAMSEGVAAAPATGRMINDIQPSSFGGAAYVSGAPAGAAAGTVPGPRNTASLGEIAAKYKAARPQNIRTYTNADAERLNGSMNVHGANVEPVSASNTAPSTPPPTLPVTQPPTTPGAAPVMSNGRPSPGTPAATAQSGQTSPASPNQSAQASAQKEGQSATTPQVKNNPAQNNGEEDNTRLPASSTLLPLFGVLGLASGAVGLWLKKYRG